MTIPESVTSIGESAFKGCTGLTSVDIPGSVTSIGNFAFSGCTGLTSVTIPNSMTNIGEYVFEDCTGLTSVTIPESVTSTGMAFSGCTGLTSAGPVGSGCNIEFQCTGELGSMLKNFSALTEVTIPETVTSIREEAFKNSGLVSITIPDSVTDIGYSAFESCKNLSSITLGSGVTAIGGGVFKECSSLTSIIIPDSVVGIRREAFYKCTSLANVAIPDSVCWIGYLAFNECNSLANIYYGGDSTQWGGIDIDLGFSPPFSNLELCRATIHYNSPIASPEEGQKTTVAAQGDLGAIPGQSDISLGQFLLECAGDYTGSVQLTSSDPSVLRLKIASSIYRGTTALTVTADTLKPGLATVTAQCHDGATASFEVYVNARVKQLVSWDTQSGKLEFASDQSDLNSILHRQYTTSRTDMPADLAGLVGQYILLSNEPQTGTGREDIHVAKIAAVTSEMGVLSEKDSEITSGSIRIGVKDYPTAFDLSASCRPLAGKPVVFHIYDGKVFQVDEVKEETGIFSDWDPEKKAVAIDGKIYYASGLTDMSFATLASDLPGAEVTYTFSNGSILAVTANVEKRLGKFASWNEQDKTVVIDGVRYSTSAETDMSFAAIAPKLIGLDVNYTVVARTILSIKVYSKVKLLCAASSGVLREKVQTKITANMVFGPDVSDLSWTLTSSDSSVVAFNPSGLGRYTNTEAGDGPGKYTDTVPLFALKAGSATITCTLSDGTAESYTVQVMPKDIHKMEEAISDWQRAYTAYREGLQEEIQKAAEVKADSEKLEDLAKMLESELEGKYKIQLADAIIATGAADTEPRIYVCKALLQMLATYTSAAPSFKDIDVKDIDKIPSKIVKEVCDGIKGTSYVYREGEVCVIIKMTDVWGAKFASISYNKNAKQIQDAKSATMTMTSSVDAVNSVMQDYVKDVIKLDINVSNQVYKELFSAFTKVFFDASPSEIATKKLQQYADTLEEMGYGKVIAAIDTSKQVHNVCSSISGHLASGELKSLEQDLKNLKGIKYDVSATKDKVIKKLVKEMDTTADFLLKCTEELWATGEITITKEEFQNGFLDKIKAKLGIHCPVDVKVFDQAGAQVGYIGSESDTWFDESVLYIKQYGEAKEIYSFGEPLSYELVGTDYGTLDCIFEEYADGSVVNRTNFYDIPLYAGKQLTVPLSDASSAPVVISEGAALDSSVSFPASDYETQTVMISCEPDSVQSGTASGGGSYVKGDSVIAYAVPKPGYVFQCWQDQDGTPVSASQIYQFTARDDCYLTAVFTENGLTANQVSAEILSAASDATLIRLRDPAGLLSETAHVLAVLYENDRMVHITEGSFTKEDMLVRFSEGIDAFYTLFFMDANYVPLCNKVYPA